IDRLAMLLDEHDRAGNLGLLNLVLEERVDLRELFGIEMRPGGDFVRAFRPRSLNGYTGGQQCPPRQCTYRLLNMHYISPPYVSWKFSGPLTPHKGRKHPVALDDAVRRYRSKNSRRWPGKQ